MGAPPSGVSAVSRQLGGAPAPVALRLAVALSAALVLPCVDFIALLLPNAAALIFPAWVQLGKDTPRGFETMGQQLILMFGQIIVLTLAMLPAALAGSAAYFIAWWLLGKVMAVAAVWRAALAAAARTSAAASAPDTTATAMSLPSSHQAMR